MDSFSLNEFVNSSKEDDVEDDEEYNEEDGNDNSVAAFIMFVPNIPSLFAYFIFAAILIRYRQVCKHTYYHFSASLAISNAAVIILFLTYLAPVTFFQREIGSENLHIAIGAMCNFLWFANIPMHILVAVNRYFNICHYHFSLKIFKPKNVALMIGSCWMYGLIFGFISLSSCCYYTYNAKKYEFDDDTWSGKFWKNINLGNSVVMMTVCVAFNVATFWYLRRNNRKIATSLSSETNTVRMKKEKKFLFLSIIVAGSLFFHEIVTIVVDRINWKSKWGGLVTTLTYVIYLSLDGMVNIFFNKIMRDYVREMIKCK